MRYELVAVAFGEALVLAGVFELDPRLRVAVALAEGDCGIIIVLICADYRIFFRNRAAHIAKPRIWNYYLTRFLGISAANKLEPAERRKAVRDRRDGRDIIRTLDLGVLLPGKCVAFYPAVFGKALPLLLGLCGNDDHIASARLDLGANEK